MSTLDKDKLTSEIIERMRAAGKAGYLDTGGKAWDQLCDLALRGLDREPELIDIVSRTAPGIILLNAISELGREFVQGVAERATASGRSARMVEVQLLVDGKPASFSKLIDRMWKFYSDDVKKTASQKAFDMVKAIGLDDLINDMRGLERQIRERLKKKGFDVPERD